MVTAENRASRPVTGWDQVLAARLRMALLSDPRAGGELRSGPTTENRKRAQRAPVELGDVWVITSSPKWGERTLAIRFHRPAKMGEEQLLRIRGNYCETLICRPPGT